MSQASDPKVTVVTTRPTLPEVCSPTCTAPPTRSIAAQHGFVPMTFYWSKWDRGIVGRVPAAL